MQYRYPVLQLVPARIRNVLSRIKNQLWESETHQEVFIAPPVGQGFDKAPLLDYKIIENGTYFSSPDWTHIWFRLDISAVENGEAGHRYLFWNVQGETTVYLDGKPYTGLDIAHPWCILPDEAVTLYLECGTYQTGVWTMAGDDELTEVDKYGLRFHGASLRVRSETAWNTYHDLDVLIQLMDYHLEKERFGLLNKGLKKNLDICSPFLRRLIRNLDESADAYDTQGLEELGKKLKLIYKSLPSEQWGMEMGIVGNSHIDLVWMWPEKITWKKAVHTLSTMLRLSERYPEMVFTISQPPLMENIKKLVPGMYADIRMKIESGQWEATGVMEVEADTLIPCGEGLIRSVLTGKKRFRELAGTEGETLWLPDVFGYSQCIPQICVLTGIKNFFTTKMTWSEVNKFPHNSFIWESSDGSGIVAHLTNCGYVSAMTVKQAIDNANAYRQSDVHNEMLLAIGYGDGGGGVTEGQCERVKRMMNLATVPKARWTGADDFFRRLSKKADKLPVYRGEMYLEYHRGTYTTQSEFKRLYRACERAMQTYEAACVLMNCIPDAEDEWKRILFAQFHDAIPGSSIREVYEQMNPELEDLAVILRQKTAELLENDERGALSFFYPLAAKGHWIVEIPLETWENTFHSANPAQRTLGSALVSLSSRGSGIRHYIHPERETNKFTVSELRMDNGRLDVGFDGYGRISSMTVDKEVLELTSHCRLVIHEDHPAGFEAWNIDRNAFWLGREYSNNMKLEVIESGPLRGIIRGKGKLGDNSNIIIDYILEQDSPVLKIKMKIDWKEKEKLLRYEIPTGYCGRNAIYGSPFGSVQRSQNIRNNTDAAMWEVPGSRWMAVVNDGGKGVGIISEAKYGFNCLDGVAGISLLRASRTPDNESIRKEECFADQGSHEINFAITKHIPPGAGLSTARFAETLYSQPLLCYVEKDNNLFSIENPGSLVFSWVKPGNRNSSYVIRFHETLGTAGKANIIFNESPCDLYMADILETECSRPFKINDKVYKVSYRPYQILSLVVVR